MALLAAQRQQALLPNAARSLDSYGSADRAAPVQISNDAMGCGGGMSDGAGKLQTATQVPRQGSPFPCGGAKTWVVFSAP